METYRLEAQHVTKNFGGVRALTDATLQVRPGEVHALMGENGAGKSTLMKVFSGAHQRDSGDIMMDGMALHVSGPKSAIDQGISTIYQEMVLAPDLSVAENIFIDTMNRQGALINWKHLYTDACEQLTRLGFSDIDPAARVGDLPVAHQQVVEICKALARQSRVLVLDEPSAVLTFTETQKLFHIIQRLSSADVSVIYISHRLEEVLEISDRITVMKDGAYVATVETNTVTKDELVRLMVGREISQLFPSRKSAIGDVILKVDGLSSGKEVHDVSFSVRAGEVLGFSGLVGAGRSETMKTIFGARKRDAGTVTLRGKSAIFGSPRQAVKQGFGFLPEDRKHEGLLLDQSIRLNVTLANLGDFAGPGGVIRKKQETTAVTEVLGSLSTKYASMDDPASSLSGGNQQKLVVGKWMLAGCDCIVFDEPTRGVDVGAKIEIYSIINRLASEGAAIILISSEMTEIIGMSDRVVVMRQGYIAGELAGDELSEENLIKLSMGVE